jgi:hypothetical protein
VVIIVREVPLLLAAGILTLAVTACGGYGAGFPPPPATDPVAAPVTISRDGRVITARTVRVCGVRPKLVARSYRDYVTLRLVNPNTNCNAEAVGRKIFVSVTLPSPLGSRRLIQAFTHKPITARVSQS